MSTVTFKDLAKGQKFTSPDFEEIWTKVTEKEIHTFGGIRFYNAEAGVADKFEPSTVMCFEDNDIVTPVGDLS